MKGTTGMVVGVLLALVIILGLYKYENDRKNSSTLYIGITDATADISGVTDIDMSINKVEVHSVENGWVTASSNSKLYSLLALKASGETKLYTKAKVPVDSYDKVRVTLGDTVVRTKASGDVKAVVPSAYIVIDSELNTKSKGSAYIGLDFLADKSLHITSDGDYVFAPVVKADYGSKATVTVTDGVVVVGEGSTDGTTSVGMDLSGKSRANFELITGKSLMIESSTDTEVKFILGGELYTSNKSEPVETSNESKVDIKIPNSIEVGGYLGPKAEIDVQSPAVNTDTDVSGGIKLGQ